MGQQPSSEKFCVNDLLQFLHNVDFRLKALEHMDEESPSKKRKREQSETNKQPDDLSLKMPLPPFTKYGTAILEGLDMRNWNIKDFNESLSFYVDSGYINESQALRIARRAGVRARAAFDDALISAVFEYVEKGDFDGALRTFDDSDDDSDGDWWPTGPIRGADK